MRDRRVAVLLAVAAAALAGGADAAKAPQAAELPLAGFYRTAVDPTTGRIFVTGSPTASQGPWKPGHLDATVAAFSGTGGWQRGSHALTAPAGIAVRPGAHDVFVALFKDNAIVQLDGSTLEEVRRFKMPSATLCPDDLAWAQGRVWFTFNCSGNPTAGVASLDPATGQIAVAATDIGSDHPVIAARGQYLVAGVASVTPGAVIAYRIAGGALKRVARLDGFGFVRDLAITARGDVLIASGDYIVVRRLPRLTPRMRYGTGGGWTAAAAASRDGHTFVGGAAGEDADVYAFHEGRPNAYWKLDFGADPMGKVAYRGLVPSTTPGVVLAFSTRYGTIHPFLSTLRYAT